MNIDSKNIINEIRNELKKNSNKENQEKAKKFFKEHINSYGIKNPVVHNLSKEYFKIIKHNPKTEIFELCDKLWQSGYIEESFIACNWSYAVRKEYKAEDFKIFKKWLENYISNWATCDTFCNHTIGEFIKMYPEYIIELKTIAKSDNRWMRRGSAVTLILLARRGMFLKEILEIADILLLDKDDMVQKGYGWMLKAASESHQQEIFDYVISKKSIMPRTALRYAIEKMPKEMKIKAMSK